MPFAFPKLLGLTRLWYSSSRCKTVLSGQRAFILPVLHVDLAQLGNDSLWGKTLSRHVLLLSVKVHILPYLLGWKIPVRSGQV